MSKNPAEELAFGLNVEKPGKEVYWVFDDGEICITSNSGRLSVYEEGMRNPIPSTFPSKLGENTYACVLDIDEAIAIRSALHGFETNAQEKLSKLLNKRNSK